MTSGSSIAPIAVIASLDTKAEEVDFVKHELSNLGLASLVLDSGILGGPGTQADIDRFTVARAGGADLDVLVRDRHSGRALSAMGAGLRQILYDEVAHGNISAVLGIGGSRGSSMASRAMRALPLGIPKIIVTPSVAGTLRQTVGSSDIVVIPTVADLLGVNRITAPALRRAVRMLDAWLKASDFRDQSGALAAMTSFGVTTPCVAEVRHRLISRGIDVVVFPANGVGGPAMEQLAAQGLLSGIIDITTHEVVDTLVGGACACESMTDRFKNTGSFRVPRVVSFGATDFVNFNAGAVPPHLSARQFYEHSATTTLMRTSVDESERVGETIGTCLARIDAPFSVLAPTGGFSEYDRVDGPFWNPVADAACVRAVESRISGTSSKLTRRDHHINDSAFAQSLVEQFLSLIKHPSSTS